MKVGLPLISAAVAATSATMREHLARPPDGGLCAPVKGYEYEVFTLEFDIGQPSGRVFVSDVRWLFLAGAYLGTLYTETAIGTGLTAAQQVQSLLATEHQCCPTGALAPVLPLN